MILYKNEEERQYCVLAKIESIGCGRGRAEGRKMSVVLSYLSMRNKKETIVMDRVDVWNSKDINKPQLADRIKEEEVGTCIVAIISKRDSDHTLLSYTKEGIFRFEKGTDRETTIICGIPKKLRADKSVDGEKLFRVGISFPVKNGDEWYKTTFYNKRREAEKAHKVIKSAKLNRNAIVIVAGKETKKDDAYCYRGVRVYELNERQIPLNNDIDTEKIITLGPYRENPIKLGDILNVPEERKKNILLWMKYVATEWMPNTNDVNFKDMTEQKEEIIKFLNAEQ